MIKKESMKRLGAWVSAAAIAAGLLAALAEPAAAAKVLCVTLQFPMDNHLGRNLFFFNEEVERATGGEIRVEVYSSAVFYKDHEGLVRRHRDGRRLADPVRRDDPGGGHLVRAVHVSVGRRSEPGDRTRQSGARSVGRSNP